MMTRVEEPERGAGRERKSERGVVIVKDFKSDRKKEKHKERKVREIYVVIKPEFSKFPKKIKVWSLSSS